MELEGTKGKKESEVQVVMKKQVHHKFKLLKIVNFCYLLLSNG